MNHNNTMEQHVDKFEVTKEFNAIGTMIPDKVNVMVFLMNLQKGTNTLSLCLNLSNQKIAFGTMWG